MLSQRPSAIDLMSICGDASYKFIGFDDFLPASYCQVKGIITDVIVPTTRRPASLHEKRGDVRLAVGFLIGRLLGLDVSRFDSSRIPSRCPPRRTRRENAHLHASSYRKAGHPDDNSERSASMNSYQGAWLLSMECDKPNR